VTRQDQTKEVPATNPVRSLPIGMWPEADRMAWELACIPSNRLRRGGRAGHLKAVTQKDLASRYGLYLDHLDRHQRLALNAAAGSQVTAAQVDAYVAELKSRVSSVTVYGSISKLRTAAQFIAPFLDLTWLVEIEKDLRFDMVPHSKADRLVLSEVLLEAGLTLIAEAESTATLSDLEKARRIRNGLMIAFLSLCPIRLRNFTALAIAATFRKIENSWWIVLSAADTKEKRPDERCVHGILAPAIEQYLATHRPVLMKGGNSHSSLWVSSNTGLAMSDDGVRHAIKATTKSTIGIDVCPHMFRTSGASTAAIHGGTNPHLGSALLNHSDPRVTEKHYNFATALSAGQAFTEVLQSYIRID